MIMANLVSKLIEVAIGEIGYLEKETNNNLYHKTNNAGDENYTKYAKDLDDLGNFYNGKKNGYSWCDVFVDWCFVKAFGVEEAKKLIYQPNKSLGAGCDYSASYYQKNNRWFNYPQIGDQIFFKTRTYSYAHTGIVIEVTPSKVITVEGNTSGANGVIYNGGGVCKKSYYINNNNIVGYGRPIYDSEPAILDKDFNLEIIKFQQWLNKTSNAALIVDGIYGPKTKEATIIALQKYLNTHYNSKLITDGVFGPLTKKACKKCLIKKGSSGQLVYIIQGLLYSLKYECNGFDGVFGNGCETAVKKFQKDSEISIDGVVGPDTFEKLLK